MKMSKSFVSCTIAGDGMVGKSSIIKTFMGDNTDEKYISTVFENHAGILNVSGEKYTVNIFDCSGQQEYSKMRIFAYKDSDVLVICYNVMDRNSFESIQNIWIPEVKNFLGKKFPIILVATQVDLRDSNEANDIELVSTDEGIKLAQDIKADEFIETSAVSKEGIYQIFENVVCSALKYRKKKMTILKRLFHR